MNIYNESVYVVTGTDLGWDCVIAVFFISSDEEYDELLERYPDTDYIIFERKIEKVKY